MLIKMDEILTKVRKEGYGVIAVSCLSLELIKAAISVAEKKCSSVILSIDLKYNPAREEQDVELFLYMARQRATRPAVPVVTNLNHGQNHQTVMRAISHGFTSITVDAPSKPYGENVIATKEVVHVAHNIGLPVEVELGRVGMVDETFVLENRYIRGAKTGLAMAKDFAERTGMDFLAISIGNVYGPYAKSITPHIDSGLLEEIATVTPIPLVLHGGSDTGDENLSEACKIGIGRINVGTDLMETATRRASQCYQENPNMGRINFLTNYVSGYQEGTGYYMDMLGSTGKAIPSATPKTKCFHPES